MYVEIDTELSFEVLNFKRKEKLGKKIGCTHIHTLLCFCCESYYFTCALFEAQIFFIPPLEWCGILFSLTHFNFQSRLKGVFLMELWGSTGTVEILCHNLELQFGMQRACC